MLHACVQFAVWCFLLAAVSAAPGTKNPKQNIPILSYKYQDNYNGSYKYSYSTANGIHVEEEGSMKKSDQTGDDVRTAKGRYSYTSPDGKIVTVVWYADDTGYHAKTTITTSEEGGEDLEDKVFEPESNLAGAMGYRG